MLWVYYWFECSSAGCFDIHGVPSPFLSLLPSVMRCTRGNQCLHADMWRIKCVLSASLLLTPHWGQQLPAWSCGAPVMAHIHTLNLCRGHTLLHPNHIFLLHQIHFYDSFEQCPTTGGLWPKNESQVCSDWTVNSKVKRLTYKIKP